MNFEQLEATVFALVDKPQHKLPWGEYMLTGEQLRKCLQLAFIAGQRDSCAATIKIFHTETEEAKR